MEEEFVGLKLKSVSYGDFFPVPAPADYCCVGRFSIVHHAIQIVVWLLRGNLGLVGPATV